MTNYDILKEYEAHKTPIPSYKEWQHLLLDNKILKQCQEIDFGTAYTETVKTKEENQKLKELLYKCREKLDELDYGCEVWQGELTGFIEEIDNAIGEKNNV